VTGPAKGKAVPGNPNRTKAQLAASQQRMARRAAAVGRAVTKEDLNSPDGYAVTVKNQAVWWYVQGFSVTQIITKFAAGTPAISVNRHLVQGWVDEAMKDVHVPPEEIARARDQVVARLNAAAQAATDIMTEWAGTELALKAIDRLVRVDDRRAKLLGLDEPVKHDVTVTEPDPTEIALREMINEAKAESARRMAQTEADFRRRQQQGGQS
jgi:hypothetical protein